MDEQTRKALELAREALQRGDTYDREHAVAAIDAALAPAAPVALTWYEGAPPFPQDQEWFIAETVYGDRVVLRSLDEGREHKHTYDFKTADGTYMATRNIRRWMQFPDCEYLPPEAPAAPVAQGEPVESILKLIDHMAYMAEIDNGDAAKWTRSKIEDALRALATPAAPVAQPLTDERAAEMLGFVKGGLSLDEFSQYNRDRIRLVQKGWSAAHGIGQGGAA